MAQPWFKFFPANFVEATYTWKPFVVGIYIRLLLYQYGNGSIPKDTEELLEISNCTIEEWNAAWKKLSKKFQVTKDGCGYFNPRMEATRVESVSSYEKRVQAAKKSHKSRKENKQNLQSNCNANCNEHASVSGSSSSSSNSSSKFKKPTKEQVAEYCASDAPLVEPEEFFDYYESQGWKKSNGQSVKDWKACVRTFQRNKEEKRQPAVDPHLNSLKVGI